MNDKTDKNRFENICVVFMSFITTGINVNYGKCHECFHVQAMSSNKRRATKKMHVSFSCLLDDGSERYIRWAKLDEACITDDGRRWRGRPGVADAESPFFRGLKKKERWEK